MRPVRSDDKIGVDRARLAVSPEGQVLLSAEFSLSLTETLRDAVNRGLALYFVTEVEIQRRRWYWLDQTVVRTELEWRLSYHALTRQFRVAAQGGQSESFGSLEEALNNLKNDHEFLLKGDVFTEDVIETWIEYKTANEINAMRLRPHPYEFALYYDA